MPGQETEKAWDRFESDIQTLAGELKRHYRSASDEKKEREGAGKGANDHDGFRVWVKERRGTYHRMRIGR